MSTKTKKIDHEAPTDGVIARLKAHKEANSGEASFVLPETGVTVTYPSFQSHDTMQKAQRLARKNPMSVAQYYITMVCKFDGEKLTLDEFGSLIPARDAMALIGEVLGNEDEDDLGNEPMH